MAQSGDAYSWAGFYIGADVGAAGGRLRASGTDSVFQLTNIDPPGVQPLTVVPGTTVSYAASNRQTSLVYGGMVGFLVQSGNWLFGLEGDAHGPRDSGAVTISSAKPPTALEPAGTYTIARSARLAWDWSARARIGYSWGEGMLYAAGGIADTRVRLSGQDSYLVPTGASAGQSAFTPPTIGPVVIANTVRGNLTGWTGGAGGEYLVAPHVGIGLDGRYTDYGSRNIDLAGCNPNSVAQGQCGSATISGAGTLTFPAGTNPATIVANSASPYPGAAPGVTRVSIAEWRVTARLVFHF